MTTIQLSPEQEALATWAAERRNNERPEETPWEAVDYVGDSLAEIFRQLAEAKKAHELSQLKLLGEKFLVADPAVQQQIVSLLP